jgi:hypothetical protein
VASLRVRRGLWLLLVVVVLGVSATAAGAMEGMDMDAEAGAGAAALQPGDPDYKPQEFRANDSSMALLFGTVFAVPVGAWFVIRSLKTKKPKKS